MGYRYLEVVRDQQVERVTLNRPQVRNAFNEDVIAELTAWASGLHQERPGTVRAVVLAGAGTSFSAGADIAWMAKMAGYSEAENLRDATAASRMFATLDTLPVPVVGRIQGAAIGGGAGLAAVCDVVVAEDRAVFAFTEVRLGILPAVISPFVMAKVGRSAARELFLTGARFTARRAHEIGLVHEVVGPTELDAAVDACVAHLLEGGPEAHAATKALIADVAQRSVAEAMPITAQAIAARRASPEGQEGLRAFLEKREPTWRG
jgi:methylglutaconyl-CoA hydratase